MLGDNNNNNNNNTMDKSFSWEAQQLVEKLTVFKWTQTLINVGITPILG